MFTFYATISNGEIRPYMPDVPVLLPASSWARTNMSIPRLPVHITEQLLIVAGLWQPSSGATTSIILLIMSDGLMAGSHNGRQRWITAVRMKSHRARLAL